MRLFCILLICGFCLGPTAGSPASAQWLKKPAKQPPPNPAAAAHQGFAGYIRRLMADARTAAAKGDVALARSLAERAHKVAITGKPMLTDAPDCSPEATAALVLQFRAIPERTVAASAVAQNAHPQTMDLEPLLDNNGREADLPLPPSPAPAIEPPQKQTTVTAQPASMKSVGSAAKSTDAQAEPSPAESHRITSLANSARKRSDKSARADHTTGFLSLQSNWLSPDAASDSAIADLADQPVRKVTEDRRKVAPNSSSPLKSTRPRPRHAPPTPESAEVSSHDVQSPAVDHLEPEVTTAIGGEVNRWQLDVEHQAAEIPQESNPQLAQDLTAHRDSAHRHLPESVLGVWSAAEVHRGSKTPGGHVISLSDFLDPHGNRPAAGQVDDAPRMIETDFRQSQLAPIPAQGSHAGEASPSNPQSQPTAKGPAVQVHDGPALEWLSATPESNREKPVVAKTIPLALDWSRWTPARKTAVMGMALLVVGFSLFGLSFRWS